MHKRGQTTNTTTLLLSLALGVVCNPVLSKPLLRLTAEGMFSLLLAYSLIGIAPQGAITFISKGWGGHVSDIRIIEHCGILEHLLPGDLVLADRGFNIHDSAGMFCAEVKLPPFTTGKKQLSKTQVHLSRKCSSVCIHVERIIGAVRQKYTILQSTYLSYQLNHVFSKSETV